MVSATNCTAKALCRALPQEEINMKPSCLKLAKAMMAQRSALQPLFHDGMGVATFLQSCDLRSLADYLWHKRCSDGCCIECSSREDRKTFQRWLYSMDFSYNPRFWRTSNVVSINVS